MGAVLVCDRIAEPLYEEGRMLLHGITFGGHPVAAAIALRNIEIFEREGVLENVREHEGYLRDAARGAAASALPIVGDVRGAGLLLGARAGPRRGAAPASAPRSASGCCAGSSPAGCSRRA